MTSTTQPEDFDIAKGIFDQLKELSADRQRRVLRWIAEGLGLGSVGPADVEAQHVPKPALGASPPATGAGAPGSTDIRSFIAAKAPKSDNQFAAAVAYFYRFEAPPEQRRETITPEGLREAARLAGRKRLGNPRATLNNAKAVGYLDTTSPGEFGINSVGENLVAMTLPGGSESPTRRKKSKPTRKGRAAGRRR